ncbi:MAG: CPBP family intramembrane metalloprotease, partial [Leptospirales bacterium]|nr:CPBP family intramembrane metalloprotease [Leptospirales bacterium]
QGKKLRDIIGFTEKIPLHKIILWSLPGVVLAALIFTIGTEIEIPLWTIFTWVPEWFWINRSLAGLDNLLVPTIILNFTIRGLLVPFTEEIYFRGFLLPRMNKFGKFAPLVNAILFSVNHLFAPWENVTRALALLPLTYIVWHKKNVYIGVVAHCVANTLGCIMMLRTIV